MGKHTFGLYKCYEALCRIGAEHVMGACLNFFFCVHPLMRLSPKTRHFTLWHFFLFVQQLVLSAIQQYTFSANFIIADRIVGAVSLDHTQCSFIRGGDGHNRISNLARNPQTASSHISHLVYPNLSVQSWKDWNSCPSSTPTIVISARFTNGASFDTMLFGEDDFLFYASLTAV